MNPTPHRQRRLVNSFSQSGAGIGLALSFDDRDRIHDRRSRTFDWDVGATRDWVERERPNDLIQHIIASSHVTEHGELVGT